MPAQPLAWMEAANLPEEAFETSKLIETYKKVQHEFHSGIILPVGEEPSGRSWTGFQSMTKKDSGFFIIYREDNERASASLQTWLTPGDKVRLDKIAGSGDSTVAIVDETGKLKFAMPDKINLLFTNTRYRNEKDRLGYLFIACLLWHRFCSKHLFGKCLWPPIRIVEWQMECYSRFV